MAAEIASEIWPLEGCSPKTLHIYRVEEYEF